MLLQQNRWALHILYCPDLGRQPGLRHQEVGSYGAGRRVWLSSPASTRNESGETHHLVSFLSDSWITLILFQSSRELITMLISPVYRDCVHLYRRVLCLICYIISLVICLPAQRDSMYNWTWKNTPWSVLTKKTIENQQTN